MGVDFIKRAAPGFHKSLDRKAVELRTPSLFNRDTVSLARSASADVCKGSRLSAGEKLLLRIANNKVVAQRGNTIVAEFVAPPAEYVKIIESGAGVAKGEVKTIHELSDTVEIGICE